MNRGTGIDHLAHERIWSESVYADCVSPDGTTGIMLRLCRYPNQSTSWLWAFAFLPEKIYGYNDHYLPCPDEVSPVEEPELTYEQTGESTAIFHRKGSRDVPLGAYVSVAVRAHGGSQAPHGQGTESMRIEADLHPRHLPWRMNRYRSEWIGEVEGTIWIGESDFKIQGLGHWHEQHQKAPRWQVPFTYISLRGEDLSLIGSAMEPNDLGHVVGSSDPKKIIKIETDPPADHRNIRLTLEDDSTLEGSIKTIHRYLVPVYTRWRPGTLVTARIGEHELSGCVNDWEFGGSK